MPTGKTPRAKLFRPCGARIQAADSVMDPAETLIPTGSDSYEQVNIVAGALGLG